VGHRQPATRSDHRSQLIDVTGPHLPRLVQALTEAFSSAPPNSRARRDFNRTCPKRGVALHCPKQCTPFEPPTASSSILVRIAVRDKANECRLLEPPLTMAYDASPARHRGPPANGRPPSTPGDARAAFDNLFKKCPHPDAKQVVEPISTQVFSLIKNLLPLRLLSVMLLKSSCTTVDTPTFGTGCVVSIER
jgi:hypothetical protein